MACLLYTSFDYLTLGWNVSLGNLRKYVRNVRLSVSVNNLATITGYSGLTPMINSSIVNNTLGIDDKRSYPVVRSYKMCIRDSPYLIQCGLRFFAS